MVTDGADGSGIQFWGQTTVAHSGPADLERDLPDSGRGWMRFGQTADDYDPRGAEGGGGDEMAGGLGTTR